MAATDLDAEAAWEAVRAARHGATVPAALSRHPLCEALLPVATARSIVVAQLGQSLDGRIATVTGASHFINGPGGVEHLHRLRALLDAVLVGVGTVLADDCRLTVRRVEGASPARVVLDPAGRVPDDASIFADDGARRLVIRAEGARRSQVQGVETVHLPVTAGQIAPGDVVAALARRGFRRVLIEGGADTVSRFVSADAVDRLHVMVAPLIVGSGRPGLALAPVAELVHARRPVTRSFPLPGGDVLFDCDMRREAETLRHDQESAHERANARGGLFRRPLGRCTGSWRRW
ncbi:RibD family protein [Chenggangzhangella methanolivorans]|uniref:RibD family protein n=1 Tax=Chenggangzhangella methanolivorans TaxID=1437009 RepID=A0A9E6R6B7_9HYPH|nr:RibD family protein [Chenggangzhangella methanolivorans]QZN98614.1 RibD family protein [Chenggangzhangella methanolivorans]